jgi:hypothetical protein
MDTMNTTKVINSPNRTLRTHHWNRTPRSQLWIKMVRDEDIAAAMHFATLCVDEDSFHQANEIAPPLPLRRNTTLYGARPVFKLTSQELEAFIDVYVKADYLPDGFHGSYMQDGDDEVSDLSDSDEDSMDWEENFMESDDVCDLSDSDDDSIDVENFVESVSVMVNPDPWASERASWVDNEAATQGTVDRWARAGLQTSTPMDFSLWG